MITSIATSIKLLEQFFAFKHLSKTIRGRHLPKFSTSQGSRRLSPTTALYVCPCEINLGCDVDDVVASDLLPKIDRKSKRRSEHFGGGKFKSLFTDKSSAIRMGRKLRFLCLKFWGYFHQINFLSPININVNRGPKESVLKR